MDGSRERPSGGSGDLRRGNLTQILRHLRDHGPSSRHAVAHACGLGVSTMTDLVTELRNRGLVRELEAVRRVGAGRPTRPIALDGEPWAVLGVSLESTRLRLQWATVGGADLAAAEVPLDLRLTTEDEGWPLLRAALQRELGTVPGARDLVSLVMGVPGFAPAEEGTVEWSADLPWDGLPLADLLRALLTEMGHHRTRVALARDIHLVALHTARSHLQRPDLTAVYLGGVRMAGGAVLVGGEIYRGRDGRTGDLGHVGGDPHGPPCVCGRRGCLEALVGPIALLVRSGLAGADEAVTLVRNDPYGVLGLLVEAAEQDRAGVRDLLVEAGREVGSVVDGLVGVLDPEVVMLGGYLGSLSPFLEPGLRAQLAVRSGAEPDSVPPVVSVGMQLDQAARGAAVAAQDAVLYDPLRLTSPL